MSQARTGFRPLAGLRVLDWTEGVAGPYACQTLGDLGADVIKVERPQGDWARGVGTGPAQGGPDFRALNRNKRDLCLDLRHPEAVEVALRLAERSDVMVTSYRPGVTERLGIGWEAVHARAPRLIYARISGFGYGGPLQHRAGSDTILQAVSGLMSQVGDPDGEPQRVGIPVVDFVAARDAVTGVLAALLARERGQTVVAPVDVSLYASAAALQAQVWQKYFEAGTVQRRSGHRNAGIAPAGLFPTSDGRHIAVAVLRDEHWQNFCTAIGRPDLLDDPRFSSNGSRLRHRPELEAEIVPVFRSRSFDEWVRILGENDVLAGPVTEVPDIAGDERLRGALPLTRLPEGALGPSAPAIALPIAVGGVLPGPERVLAPPARGQHTREVLREVGYAEAEIERLVASGATPEVAPGD
ncbi:MAG TPA: CoA transferase [Candidatus Dormibacteraeota bacterium]|nr:CoA transferase [Candidatus Dormibacteraeota bacterium]